MNQDTQSRVAEMARVIAREQAVELEAMAAKATDGEATLTIKLTLKRDGPERTISGTYKVSYTEAVTGVVTPETFDPRQAQMKIGGES